MVLAAAASARGTNARYTQRRIRALHACSSVVRSTAYMYLLHGTCTCTCIGEHHAHTSYRSITSCAPCTRVAPSTYRLRTCSRVAQLYTDLLTDLLTHLFRLTGHLVRRPTSTGGLIPRSRIWGGVPPRSRMAMGFLLVAAWGGWVCQPRSRMAMGFLLAVA